ncbi:hypothetical protein J7643_17920 [bacterium]|nr:hypothetical protein [bacterium]
MPKRRFGLFAAALLLAGCPGAGGPDPGSSGPPLREPGVTFPISGELMAPKAFLSTTEKVGQILVFKPEALAGQTIYLADAKLQPLKDGPTVKTDTAGKFTIQSPERAGFLMTRVGSMSVPLAAFYREKTSSKISAGSTMVAWKISQDMASRSIPITTLDPAKIAKANQLIEAELIKSGAGKLKPDFSLDIWVRAMDDYPLKEQGEYAKAFNEIIPQSVGPKPTR